MDRFSCLLGDEVKISNFFFLKKALPFEIDSLSFSDIRGNILTRVQKLKDSNADGLAIAKAALDRLLSPKEEVISELDSFREDLDEFLWMVIPCSQNPCARTRVL